MLDRIAIEGYVRTSTFLAAEDDFNKTGEFFIFAFQAIVVTIFAVCLITNIGLPLITGGQEGREKAKKNLPGMLLGLIAVLGALTISQAIKSKIAFTQ